MRWLKILIGTLGIGFAGFLLVVTFPAWSSLFSSTPTSFTPEAWHDAHQYRREVMARDFMDRQAFIGSVRKDIEGMLGKPDYQDNNRIHYVVAITAADYMLLTFEFDASGRALKAYLHQS
jgi:hypothetical protein